MAELNIKLAIVVAKFHGRMKGKLRKKEGEGYKGWDNPELKETLKKQLNHNLIEGDYVDVANLAMLLDNLQ